MFKVVSRYLSYFVVIYILNFSSSLLAQQEDTAALLIAKMCYACHQLDSTSLGPPWRAIAARHGARKELMADVLATKIIAGGGGNWGLVPMVPNQRVNAEEARQMARWILDLAPTNP